MKSESEVAQSCPTLSDPMDCSLPGSSIHGIFQARVLEWVAIAFSELARHCVKHLILFHLTLSMIPVGYLLGLLTDIPDLSLSQDRIDVIELYFPPP